MAELDPYLGDSLDVSINGTWYQCYEDMTGPSEPDMINIPQTRGRGPVDVPRAYLKESYKFTCQDETGSAKWLALKTVMDAKTPVTCIIAFEGNVAGNLTASGSAYVAVSGISTGPGKPGTFTLSINFSTVPTYAPNIVLTGAAVGLFGAVLLTPVGQGDAYSGANLVPTGGTSTYGVVVVGGAGAMLVEGLTISATGVIGGTANAQAPIGLHYFVVEVTDSAATPVVKQFLCAIEVVA
jgi:hypothetical protein